MNNIFSILLIILISPLSFAIDETYGIANVSPTPRSELPVFFIDPACLACKEFLPELARLPADSYQIAIVSAVLPTESSIRRSMWHLSNGGGFEASKGGCRSDCATLKTITNEDVYSMVLIDKENELVTETGMSVLDPSGSKVYLRDQKLSNEDGKDVILNLMFRDKRGKTLTINDKSIYGITSDRHLTIDGETVMVADMEIFPKDYLLRMARLATNTRVLKALGGDQARTPSVYVDGQYIVIESKEQFMKMFSIEEDL